MAKKGFGNITIREPGFDEMFQLHYHTYVIRSGSHTYLFTGAKSSLPDALETAQNLSGSPYKPKYTKVNA